jgi:hypothetical protein
MGISQSSAFSIEGALNDMSVQELESLHAHLMDKSGKTTNRVKMKNIHTYFKAYISLVAVQQKVTASMDAFKVLLDNDLQENWTSDDGILMMDELKQRISNIIAVAKSRQNDMKQ